MKGENLKILTVLVVILLIIAGIAVSLQLGLFSDLLGAKTDQPLTVKAFADENTGLVPHAVNFTAIITNYEGKLEYNWDFGDGETSNEVNPVHTYKENGTYQCTLKVADESGEKKSDNIKIEVKENQPPTVTVELSENKFSRPYKIGTIVLWSKLWDFYEGRYIRPFIDKNSFPSMILPGESDLIANAQVYDPEGDEIVSYNWSIQAPTYSSSLLTGGRQVKPTYNIEGEEKASLPLALIYSVSQQDYVVKLTVEDSAGNIATGTKTFKVENSPQEVQFNTFKYSIKSLKTNWLLKYSKQAIIASTVYNIIAKIYDVLPEKPIIKIITQFILQSQLNIGSRDINAEPLSFLAEQFFENHPKLANFSNNILYRVQENILPWIGEKLPFLESTMIGLSNNLEIFRENIGLENKRPVIQDPFPENEAKRIPRDCAYVSVNVTDAENDTFDVTISGEYINSSTNHNVTYKDVKSGVYNATLMPLPPREEIQWHVEVVDQNGKVVTKDYSFVTFT
jgi:hypothetical protein